MNTPVAIALDAVRFAYPGGTAMTFDLEVEAGTVTAIMGPSGSGKSTLLDLIAGFRHPSAGRISIGGADVTDLPPHRRPISMVFQDNNLFGHLDVVSNVGLGISASLKLDAEDRAAIERALEETGLAGKGGRLPADLSGGERQRVAIARVLVRDRPVLLMDEPFASLGPALREEMGGLVRRLQEKRGLTVALVTHDPNDARLVSSRMVFVDEGRIAATGTTEEFFAKGGPPAFHAYVGSKGGTAERQAGARKPT
jgi:thiamine transport system ATP-binding protein